MSQDAATDPRFATGFSQLANAQQAVAEACQNALARLGAKPHLAIVFAAGHEPEDFPRLAETLRAELDTDCLLGCTAESLVFDHAEIEGQQGLVVWLAHLPSVRLTPMHLTFERTDDGVAMLGWPEELGDTLPSGSCLLLLADPFTFPTDVLLEHLNRHQAGIPVFGGMASGAMSPGENRLLLGERAYDDGAVAVLIDGPVRIRHVVSQGCRPIGRPFIVTKAQDNVLLELGGRPAFDQLREVYQQLAPADQQLVQRGLHVGQVINEYQEQFDRGDFLVRNVQGIDSARGSIAIGDFVRVGQTVQFHIRDAATADEDLEALLSAAAEQSSGPTAGALVFTCNGRGTRLFPEPHHDAQAVARRWPGLPTAGFFAQGEIGPIGGKNFLHGFTASIALFEGEAPA